MPVTHKPRTVKTERKQLSEHSSSHQAPSHLQTTPFSFLPTPPKNDTDTFDNVFNHELNPDTAVINTVIAQSNPYALIDVKSSLSTGHKSGGCPKKSVLNTFLQTCYRQSNPGKHLFRCVGDGCRYTLASRNLKRILRHARTCQMLTSALRMKAKKEAAKNAPSTKATGASESDGEGDSDETGSDQCQAEVADGMGGSDVENNAEPSPSKKRKTTAGKPGLKVGFFNEAKILGRAQRQADLDLAIIKLFCVAGLPTSLVSRPEWRNVFTLADPTYKPASREKLEVEQIVGEAEKIIEKLIKYLRTQENLTISYDGGTTRGREAMWTLHISTPNGKVYLMEVRQATDVSHTGLWIKTFALEVRVQRLNSPWRYIY